MSTQKMEQFYPPIQSDGLNTDKAVSFGTTLAVTGATTLTGAATANGTLTANGAATFNSSATFATAPTFSGGQLASIVNATTNATLTISQSGSTVVFNRSLGTEIALPVPTIGIYYDFVVATTPTSGTTGIRTSTSTFLYGALQVGAASGTLAQANTANTFVALANGTSNSVVSMNGTTTGGILGTKFRVTATTATQWEVSGIVAGSGSLATPIV